MSSELNANSCSITIQISEKEKSHLQNICQKISEKLSNSLTIESYIQFLIEEELKIEEKFLKDLKK